MGVDHGLGGRNGEKSKKRRQKKAKQVAAIAKQALGKKKEVIFNEDARVDYLTGFRKRKQERREYGHAMEILKKNKQKLDKRKEIRQAMNSALREQEDNAEKNEFGNISNRSASDEEDEDDKEGKISGNTTFDDEATQAMFGGIVDVKIDTGIADEMDRNFQETASMPLKSTKDVRKDPTKLEKALAKARFNLNNAPKQKKGKLRREGNKPNELLNKALGPGKGIGRNRGGKRDRGAAERSKRGGKKSRGR